MNLVAPHLNVTERIAAIGQLEDEEPSAMDAAQLNNFDPNILKTSLKISKSKKKSAV